MADVTIIVPAYNLERYIKACLESILAQTSQAWSCIVVDDGSQDATVIEVALVADHRIKLVQQANAGVSSARNRGLAEVVTPYVMFLDGDDLLHSSAIERLLAALEGHKSTVAAFGALRKVLENGQPYPGEKPLGLVNYPSGDVLAAIVRENFLANGGHVLIRTEAARQAGGFSTLLKLSEDWEFWCRLALLGGFSYIGAPPEVFYLRMTPGSASGGLSINWENHKAAIETVLGNSAIRSRFTPSAWARLSRQVWASHRWEAGRVNFTCRQFKLARQLMLTALAADPTPKRLALFALAQISELMNRSFVSRLRFRDDDAALSGAEVN